MYIHATTLQLDACGSCCLDEPLLLLMEFWASVKDFPHRSDSLTRA